MAPGLCHHLATVTDSCLLLGRGQRSLPPRRWLAMRNIALELFEAKPVS